MFLGRKDLDFDGATLLEGVPLSLLPGDLELEGNDDASIGRHTLVQNVAKDLSILLALIFLTLFVKLLLLFQQENLMVGELLCVINRGIIRTLVLVISYFTWHFLQHLVEHLESF